MIGKNFEFNGQSLSRTTADYRLGLDVVQWKSLDVSDEQQNVQGFHGIRVSPTFARGRRITLEGIIIADDRVGSSMAIDWLESLFSLQGTPDVVELLPFIVTDDQDRRWQLDCKIKETLSIDIADDDFMDGANRRWRVVLQSQDPRYFSVTDQTESGVEGVFGGFKLGAKLGAKMDSYFNSIQIITTGNIETPVTITITALGDIDSPLIIHNITTGTFFGLEISAVTGDVIVINSKLMTATKNGVNVLAYRTVGSTWPKAFNTTAFSVYDQDGGMYGSDFDISISFKNVLL